MSVGCIINAAGYNRIANRKREKRMDASKLDPVVFSLFFIQACSMQPSSRFGEEAFVLIVKPGGISTRLSS